MAERRNWTREEVLHALRLYLATPFGRIHGRNPDIAALAQRLGRSVNSVALKMVNLAALDDSLPRKGMGNVSKLDRAVWADFLARPEAVLAVLEPAETDFAYPTRGSHPEFAGFGEGQDVVATVKARRGQTIFREAVLTSYGGRCAVTGVDDPRLLNASHIIPWAEDPARRLDPRNGICLNALHDRAFDRHLISFDESYRVMVSPRLPASAGAFFANPDYARLRPPERFLPSQDFLEAHRRNFHDAA